MRERRSVVSPLDPVLKSVILFWKSVLYSFLIILLLLLSKCAYTLIFCRLRIAGTVVDLRREARH